MREKARNSLHKLLADGSNRPHDVHWVLRGEGPTKAGACLYSFLATSLTSQAFRLRDYKYFDYANTFHLTKTQC